LKEIVSGVMLTVLLIGMLKLASNIQQVKAEDALLLEMNANKNVITIGEKINITLTLKNVGETNVTITYTPPLFDVYYCTPKGCFRWSDGMYFIQVVLQFTLKPGENYSDTLQWDLYQFVNGEHHPPKPRTYYLLGICYPAGIMTPSSIAVTLIELPVGGYSLPIKAYTAEKPLILYLALIAILAASFTMIKRRKKQQS